MVSKGGYKRRATRGIVPVSFHYIVDLVKKVDEKFSHYPNDLISRNKALIVWLYYSGRRISELVGRRLRLDDESFDVWEGVKVKDFHFDMRDGRELVIMKCRILKKGKAKADSIRQVFREVAVYCDWPLMKYFLEWFKLRKLEGLEAKMFNLSRSRAYQILKELDPRIIGNHWFRHQRLSHLARYLTPFQLNERIGFWEKLDPAISYVHGTVEEYLEGADKVCACI